MFFNSYSLAIFHNNMQQHCTVSPSNKRQKLFFLLLIIISESHYVNTRKASIIFGGDVSFSGIMKHQIETGKCTYNTSFEVIRKYFKEADEVVVNLESNVAEKENVDKWEKADKLVTLLSEEDSLKGLKYVFFNQLYNSSEVIALRKRTIPFRRSRDMIKRAG